MTILISIAVIILGWVLIRYGIGFLLGGVGSLLGCLGLKSMESEKNE